MLFNLVSQIFEPGSLVEKLLDDNSIIQCDVVVRRLLSGHGIPPVTVPASVIHVAIILKNAFARLITYSLF